MTTHTPPAFDAPDLLAWLQAASDADLDAQTGFGIIGFAPDTRVTLYSATESRMAQLKPDQVLGLPLFDVVAQCMNNYLVAQRFEDALAAAAPLDETLPYVLSLRMRPTPVHLRLLAGTGGAPDTRYICIRRGA